MGQVSLSINGARSGSNRRSACARGPAWNARPFVSGIKLRKGQTVRKIRPLPLKQESVSFVGQGSYPTGKATRSRRNPAEVSVHLVVSCRYVSHLKRCNVRTREEAMRSCPYFKQDINSGSQGSSSPSSQPVMSDAEDPVGLVGRVNENYEIHVRAIEMVRRRNG